MCWYLLLCGKNQDVRGTCRITSYAMTARQVEYIVEPDKQYREGTVVYTSTE